MFSKLKQPMQTKFLAIIFTLMLAVAASFTATAQDESAQEEITVSLDLYSQEGAPAEWPVVVGKGWIKLPAVEGRYLKSVTMTHSNTLEKRTFRVQETVSDDPAEFYGAVPFKAKPGAPAKLEVVFPTNNRAAGNLRNTKVGTSYVLMFDEGPDADFLSVSAVYTSKEPVDLRDPSKTVEHIIAHRGAWRRNAAGEFVIPENSLAGIAEAARLGYEGIELDVQYTKDKQMVVLHDKTLGRTLRTKKKYTALTEQVRLKDVTFDQLRKDYVMECTDRSLRTPVPTLKEMLLECKRHNIIPMLHTSIVEAYRLATEILGDNWICFTNNLESCKAARAMSSCLVLYSVREGTPEGILPCLEEIGGRCGVTTVKFNLYTKDFIKEFREAGYQVQASIFPPIRETLAVRNGISYVLTDHLFPIK